MECRRGYNMGQGIVGVVYGDGKMLPLAFRVTPYVLKS